MTSDLLDHFYLCLNQKWDETFDIYHLIYNLYYEYNIYMNFNIKLHIKVNQLAFKTNPWTWTSERHWKVSAPVSFVFFGAFFIFSSHNCRQPPVVFLTLGRGRDTAHPLFCSRSLICKDTRALLWVKAKQRKSRLCDTVQSRIGH